MSLMFKVSSEFLLKAEIQKFSKLLEINCLQIMKSKLTIIPQYLTCFTHTCQLCIPGYHCRGVFKNIFWYACSLLIFVAKQATKSTELQFLCTQGNLRGGRIGDHRMTFTKHLHLLQSYIQAILYIYKTDCMMSLITVHISYAPRICSLLPFMFLIK